MKVGRKVCSVCCERLVQTDRSFLVPPLCLVDGKSDIYNQLSGLGCGSPFLVLRSDRCSLCGRSPVQVVCDCCQASFCSDTCLADHARIPPGPGVWLVAVSYEGVSVGAAG